MSLPETSSSVWSIATNTSDYSFTQVLQPLFGMSTPYSLLTNVSNDLFKTMFTYFNTGLLSIAFVIYAFIVIVGTINTAKDGEMLGRNWSSYWIPLRVIFGSLCAIPMKTGYCVAQYIVFVLVLSGVSFADYLWYNVVHDVVSENVPPSISSQVTDNIKGDLSVLMMSQFTEGLISGKSDYSFVGSGEPCSKNGKQISCDILFDTPVTDGMVQSYAVPIAAASTADNPTKDTNCTSDSSADLLKNCPFYNYSSILNQGMTSWSKVDGDDYSQFQLFNSTWSGNYTFKDLDNSSAIDALNGLGKNQKITVDGQKLETDADGKQKFVPTSTDYSVTYDTGNLKYITNPWDQDYINSSTLIADQSAHDELSKTATNLINSLENNTNVIKQSCSDSDINNICGNANQLGWWNADTLYLQLDNDLSLNLKNLYENFANISNSVSGGLTNTQMPIIYNKLKISYYASSNSINDLLNGATTQLTVPSDNKSKATVVLSQQKNGKTVYNFPNITQKSSSFANSMSNVRDIFNRAIYLSNGIPANNMKDAANQCQSMCGSCATLTAAVNSLITDGMQFKYSQYLYIISSLVNTSLSQLNSSDSASSVSSTTSSAATKLVKEVITPTLNLFGFFQANGVNFGASQQAADTSGVTDPAQDLLSTIFQNLLGGAVSSQEVGGLLEQIYNIGTVQGDPSDTNFAAQNFSMIQYVQSVGMSLIEGTINDMLQIFGNAKDQLTQIGDYAKQQADDIKSDATGWAIGGGIASAFGIGSVSQIGSAVINAQFAEAMFNVSMKLASFSLSLIWLPMVIFVLTTIFGIGVSFSLVIPLTPFILFWAGKIAWLLLVIEAMFAAPFVALGLVYPEGHEVFGKTEPAIQICMNLVLRPVFMIAGMIAGIGLTYVVISVSAQGFQTITNSLLYFMPVGDGTDAATYARGVFSMLIIFMYATFLSMAFMKCFSLIYVIPDKVLQWIGNTRAERAGEAEMQEFKGAATQYAQQGAQAGGQTLNEGINSEKNYTQTQQQGQFDTAKADSNRNMTIGTEAGKTAGQAGQMAAELMA